MNYNGALNKGVLDRFMALDISNTNKVKPRGVSSVPFPFLFPFHLHFNLVSSIIALVPNAFELERQLK